MSPEATPSCSCRRRRARPRSPSAPSRAGAPADVIALGGGPARFVQILADQLERRRRRDVPELDGDPDWTLTLEGFDPRLERVHESLLTLADGRIGTRGTPLAGNGSSAPGVVVSGLYDGDGPATRLAVCPDWTRIGIISRRRRRVTRRLDLSTGVLREDGSVTALRFASLARPGTVALRARATADFPLRSGRHRVTQGATAMIVDHRRASLFERLGAYDAEENVARAALADAEEAGFDTLLREQREAWARRWQDADVVIEGDAESPARDPLRALPPDGIRRRPRRGGCRRARPERRRVQRARVLGQRRVRAPVPRGHASGRGAGDARVPGAAPPAPRARPRALSGATARASRGSRPRRGTDVTPPSARLARASSSRSAPASCEEHIVADVAWAAACYVDWTGDAAFAAGAGRDLFVETARYWASRVRLERDGPRAHLRRDRADEYHEPVDDNAFTNVMARWNLRRARRGRTASTSDERRTRGCELADALVDGYDRDERHLRAVRRLLRPRAAGDRRRSRRAGRSPPTCCSGASGRRARR